MKKTLFLLFAAAACVYLTPTVAAKKKTIRTPEIQQAINVLTEPAGAQVYYNGKLVCPSTPGMISIPIRGEITPDKKNMDQAYEEAKKKSSITLTFVKDGYIRTEEVLEPSVSFQKTGILKMYTFDWPKNITVKMNVDPNGIYAQDPTIPNGAAGERVSRDKAGKTALERTIIRWFFDSDPQGAHIFYRVISSVPSEVKNTNETHLMTTPFEETRSFNIQGLTYENSRDVQVEIKVVKNGYEPQVKRFNVRQAIDQQEISSFFMLVKKEE